MKQNQRKNMINSIQQNLKQMRQQAQSYIEKHKSNLPPICTARHYLFHTIDAKPQTQGFTQFRPTGSYKLPKQTKTSPRQTQKQTRSLAKRAVCTLQFDIKQNPQHLNLSGNMQEPFNNSTSMKLRMGMNWRTPRYLQSNPSKNNFETAQSADKIKNIVMNSQIIQRDIKASYNFSFTPKLSKLQMPKRESDMLRKYINSLKQTQSEQIKIQTPPPAPKIEQQLQKIEQRLQNTTNQIKKSEEYMPKQILIVQQNVRNIRRRRSRKKTEQNHEIHQKQLQKQVQKQPKKQRQKQHHKLHHKSYHKRKGQPQITSVSLPLPSPTPALPVKKIFKKQYDITEGDYTPWGNSYNNDECYACDFS